MFAWESAVTGVELAGPPWGTDEMHISSDIALFVNQFWRATRDNSASWLNDTAWPLASGIAEFWMSKLAIDNPGAAAGSPLSVLRVMGPDEYHTGVNNSAYTNAGVIQSLRTAVLIAQQLGLSRDVYAAWEAAASAIIMPWDPVRLYHPECVYVVCLLLVSVR